MHLDSCLSRVPDGSHTWLDGDLNLPGINWESSSVKPHAAQSAVCKQLLEISESHFLKQQVTEPTWITTTMSSVLVLFFTDNSSLVNTAKVIPGISDHEAVYVDASLRPHQQAAECSNTRMQTTMALEVDSRSCTLNCRRHHLCLSTFCVVYLLWHSAVPDQQTCTFYEFENWKKWQTLDQS